MKSHVSYGICAMAIWCLFLFVLFGGYLAVSHQPISYFADEETGGIGFALFFLLWMFIWYKIGSHYRKMYLFKKAVFQKRFPELSQKDIDASFRKECIAKFSKVLAIVFGTAVPWYTIGNIRETVDTKDVIYLSLLVIATIIFASCYRYYKKR